MRIFTAATALSTAIGLAILTFAAAWFVAVPGVLTPLTFAIVLILTTAVIGVARLTYRNSEATGNIGQLIHETDRVVAPQRRSERM